MKNEQTIKAIINKACNNGMNYSFFDNPELIITLQNCGNIIDKTIGCESAEGKEYAINIEKLIFSYDFLKAYFGEEFWKDHAIKLVLEEDRIEYLKQFL
jgi:hypothetical protein